MLQFDFNNPTHLLFGRGMISALGQQDLPAKGARSMQGGLFAANPCEMTDEDCAGMFEKSYR